MRVSIEHVFLANGANGREVLTEDSAFWASFFFFWVRILCLQDLGSSPFWRTTGCEASELKFYTRHEAWNFDITKDILFFLGLTQWFERVNL